MNWNPDRCVGQGPGRSTPAPPRTVTLTDIASFRPNPVFDRMEPAGWTIVGLNTNFYGVASTHIVNGTLLGRPAQVRFTPVSYRWTYGDGATRTTSSRGNTWAALGVPEFTPTATSHVYAREGTYTITLRVVHVAAYRYNGGAWTNVSGTITVRANDLVVSVGDASTVLVDDNCTANPTGPGC